MLIRGVCDSCKAYRTVVVYCTSSETTFDSSRKVCESCLCSTAGRNGMSQTQRRKSDSKMEKRNAVTLAEVLVALAIIGIVVALIVAGVRDLTGETRNRLCPISRVCPFSRASAHKVS